MIGKQTHRSWRLIGTVAVVPAVAIALGMSAPAAGASVATVGTSHSAAGKHVNVFRHRSTPTKTHGRKVGGPMLEQFRKVGSPALTHGRKVGSPTLTHGRKVGSPTLTHGRKVGSPTLTH
ncbi:MAG: hypothetical protein ABSG43_22970, partial [Solirubrobacteraceae bacterium]